MKRLATILCLTLLLCGPAFFCPVATACPNCRDATKATPGASSDSQFREAQAFNRSIYLMAGMPFFLLGGFGFALYRLAKSRTTHPR